MTNTNPENGELNEPIDATKCIANTLGLAGLGLLSRDKIAEIIAKRDSVGKGSRSRFGRLLCEREGCDAACNVELVDGIPVTTDMGQLFGLLDNCVVYHQTTIQPNDTKA